MASVRPTTADGAGFRSIPAPGWSADAVAAQVLAALQDVPGLVVSELAPGRLGVARARRPRWATVACGATIWLGGLGLLFLLVRRTDAGEVAIHDGPRGCSVLIPPLLERSTVDRITEALHDDTSTEVPVEPVEVAAPARPDVELDDALDERTVARSVDPTVPADRPRSGLVVTFRFDAGAAAIAAGERVVLGRDPSPTATARAEVVPGDATTVSKSHLLVVVDESGVLVEDLGSTNGTALLDDDPEQVLVPGAPRRLEDGARLRLGATRCVVSITRGGADGPVH